MTTVEVTLSEELDAELDRLVDQGAFLSCEQAVEELLALALSSYDEGASGAEGVLDESFMQSVMDQQDPAGPDSGDGYTY